MSKPDRPYPLVRGCDCGVYVLRKHTGTGLMVVRDRGHHHSDQCAIWGGRAPGLEEELVFCANCGLNWSPTISAVCTAAENGGAHSWTGPVPDDGRRHEEEVR